MPAEGDFTRTEEFQDQSLHSNIMEKEKQISVDPRSLRHLRTSSRLVDDRSLVPPLSPAIRDAAYPQLPLPPAKLKFISASLPNSATSSPRSGSSNVMKNIKKWRNQNQSSLARQHSATVSHLRRSKSCSEGRACAPSDEFDFWARRAMVLQREMGGNIDIAHFEFDHNDINYNFKNREDQLDSSDKAFKCGALCLFLPGFGKGKPVRAIKRREVNEEEMRVSNISRTVSLEKFECGSWASSPRVAAISSDNESAIDQSGRSYFDLPMELIRDGVNDTHSPVSTAFVFERDRKGALTKSTLVRVKPQESSSSSSSSRHVRFSASSNSKSRGNSPSCISPRLVLA